MAIRKKNDITWITFQLFDQYQIIHGFFMRHGGCSPIPWKSLNMATSVGDSSENVIENRKRMSNAIGINMDSIFDVWQVHGSEIIYSSIPREISSPHMKGDAISTNSKDIALLMLFADCVPVMVYDPEADAAMIIHAGWHGTIDAIVLSAIRFMINKFGSRKNNIIAGIGPAICIDHYEVGREIYDSARMKLADDAVGLVKRSKYHLDLALTNKRLLQSEGISRIEMMPICTACSTEDWFSHRGEKGKTGRFAGLIKPRYE